MRAIDGARLIAMNEIKLRGDAISTLAKEYARVYKDQNHTVRDQMDILDDIWRLITENQIRLTEVLRQNGR